MTGRPFCIYSEVISHIEARFDVEATRIESDIRKERKEVEDKN